MAAQDVVRCLIRHETDILVGRRRDSAAVSPHRWDIPYTRLDTRQPDDAAWGLLDALSVRNQATFVRSGTSFKVDSDRYEVPVIVHPYLFECGTSRIHPPDEFAATEWIQPPLLLERDTVPRLWETYTSVAPSLATVREDTEHGAAYISLRALEVLRDHAADVIAAGNDHDFVELAVALRDARPAMGVVSNRINRVMSTANSTSIAIKTQAMDACENARSATETVAAQAASSLGEQVLTMSRSRTVVDTLRVATPESVYVAESRPQREGVAVAEDLASNGVTVALFVDAAIRHIITTEPIDTVVVGADSILADGTIINKVGTHLAVLAAADVGIDVYVVCSQDKIVPVTTPDFETGPPNDIYSGPLDIEVINPIFEATPGTRVSGVITESGRLSVEDIRDIATTHQALTDWAS